MRLAGPTDQIAIPVQIDNRLNVIANKTMTARSLEDNLNYVKTFPGTTHYVIHWHCIMLHISQD